MSEDARLRIEPAGVGADSSERDRRLALIGLGICSALSLAMPAIATATDTAALCFAASLPMFGMLAALGRLGIVALPERAPLHEGMVEVDGKRLMLTSSHPSARRTILLANIVQGYREHPNLVYLVTRAGETLVVRPVRDAHAACERLLHACGVSASERTLRVPLPSAAARIYGGRLLAGMALACDFVLLFMVMIALGLGGREIFHTEGLRGAWTMLAFVALGVGPLAALGYAVLRALGRREAIVGADGVVFRGALRARRVAYDDVARIAHDRRGVRLHRRDGSSLLLPTTGAAPLPMPPLPTPSGELPEGEAHRDVLFHRIQDAMAARAQGAFDRPGLDALDRRGRAIDTWREELARVTRGDADYRRAPLTGADLGGVIEDAAAPAERRIAAAVALSTSAPEEARRRVRIAVDACADEELKRALEQAGEGEIDEALIDREASRRVYR